MLRIVFLGTSASISTKQRDNTSILLYNNKKDLILLDCPGSIVQKLQRLNLDFTRLTKVIITHHHPDHIYGIISLLHCQFRTTKKITIYSSKTSIKIIKELTKLFGLQSKDYPRITFVNLFNKKRVSLSGKVKISAFNNTHCRDSFGVNILYKDKNIVYSSDTAITDALPLVNRSTYLIHDCTSSSKFFKKYPDLYKMHTESSQLKNLALKTNPKLLVPIHFLLLAKGEFKKIKRELKGLKNVFLPKDYSCLTIK
ncbi:MAG: ribonuclease Z [Candidatus Omnitrophica bacterium]|nr:ribonuclease Z [Candidatus Omnitrophota bacterium]